MTIGFDKMIRQDFWEGFREFSHAFHISPLAYKECANMANEVNGII